MKRIKKFAVALITGLAVIAFFLLLTSYQNDSTQLKTHVIYVIPEAKIIGKIPVADVAFELDESEPELELEDWMFDIEHYKN